MNVQAFISDIFTPSKQEVTKKLKHSAHIHCGRIQRSHTEGQEMELHQP